MKIENFILSIIRKIEEIKPGIIAYAYKDGNETKTCVRWIVCVSDFDFYMNDSRFKTLSKAWHAAGKARKEKIIFCYCSPKEKKLAELAESDNLIMNI